jgi:hypothetical protein
MNPDGNGNEQNPSVRFERTDLSVRAVALFGAVLVASLAVVMGGLWWMLHVLTTRAADEKHPNAPWVGAPAPGPTKLRAENEAGGDRSRLPSIPPLESEDLELPSLQSGQARPGSVQEQYAREDARLEKGDSKEAIPIAQAMKALARPGMLPADPKGKDVDEFLEAPSRSSSGRKPRGGGR